mmetsp:Transcript_24226/g.38749  ORF Transcript_24226/g.38749 Transcript_24226/m.38749 type:complete len:254 (+) Transcript_24226:410-1171(+)
MILRIRTRRLVIMLFSLLLRVMIMSSALSTSNVTLAFLGRIWFPKGSPIVVPSLLCVFTWSTKTFRLPDFDAVRILVLRLLLLHSLCHDKCRRVADVLAIYGQREDLCSILRLYIPEIPKNFLRPVVDRATPQGLFKTSSHFFKLVSLAISKLCGGSSSWTRRLATHIPFAAAYLVHLPILETTRLALPISSIIGIIVTILWIVLSGFVPIAPRSWIVQVALRDREDKAGRIANLVILHFPLQVLPQLIGICF